MRQQVLPVGRPGTDRGQTLSSALACRICSPILHTPPLFVKSVSLITASAAGLRLPPFPAASAGRITPRPVATPLARSRYFVSTPIPLPPRPSRVPSLTGQPGAVAGSLALPLLLLPLVGLDFLCHPTRPEPLSPRKANRIASASQPPLLFPGAPGRSPPPLPIIAGPSPPAQGGGALPRRGA